MQDCSQETLWHGVDALSAATGTQAGCHVLVYLCGFGSVAMMDDQGIDVAFQGGGKSVVHILSRLYWALGPKSRIDAFVDVYAEDGGGECVKATQTVHLWLPSTSRCVIFFFSTMMRQLRDCGVPFFFARQVLATQ
jgi:hypothetical protein